MRGYLLGLTTITALASLLIWAASPAAPWQIPFNFFNQQANSSSSSSSIGLSAPEAGYAASTLKLNFTEAAPAPLAERRGRPVAQTGWIPDWAFSQGYASISQASSKFVSVSPVWYYLKPDGSVNASRVGQAELASLRSRAGVKIIPSIASFNSDEFGKILNSRSKTQKHIDFLKQEVETYNLDGLDLDYESIYFHNQENYVYLVRSLYEYLDSKGKVLSIAVMPNWTPQHIHRGSIQTRQAQDWQILGQYSHEIRIMTYNLTGASNKYPGPIGPLDWLEANLRYAAVRIDPEKIFLGVHLYVYAGWQQRPNRLTDYLGTYSNPFSDKILASALTYKDILNRRLYGTSDRYDKFEGESILEYTRDGASYIAYYIDRQGMEARRALSKRYGIGGVAYWRLGDEDVAGY